MIDSYKQKYLTAVIYFFCFCLSSYFLASFFFLVFSNHFPGSYFDYWVDMERVRNAFDPSKHIDWINMLSAHNEAHRILIPRILFILDYYFSSGTNALLMTISILCKIFILLVLNLNIKEYSIKQKILLNTIFISGIFHITSIWNIILPSNIQWDLALAFGFSSVHFFIRSEKSMFNLLLSFVFCLLALFSQAISMAIPIFFSMYLLLKKNKLSYVTYLTIFFCATLVFANFFLMPNLTKEINSNELSGFYLNFPSNLMFLYYFPNFILRFIYAPVRLLEPYTIYFSLPFFLVFFYLLKRNSQKDAPSTNIFIYCAFTLIVISVIAGGRIASSPYYFGAGQYHPIAALFLMLVTASFYIYQTNSPASKLKKISASLLCLIYFFMLLWDQLQPSNRSTFPRSNAALQSHAEMFMYERNQLYGGGLKIWVQEYDVMKDNDLFFSTNGYAYYHNKQGGNGFYKHLIPTGNQFVDINAAKNFVASCHTSSSPIEFTQNQKGDFEFSSSINLQQINYLYATLFRDSYYVLDEAGKVIGFSYIHMPPDMVWPLPSINGIVKSTNPKYIAEVKNGQPVCLYVLDISPH